MGGNAGSVSDDVGGLARELERVAGVMAMRVSSHSLTLTQIREE